MQLTYMGAQCFRQHGLYCSIVWLCDRWAEAWHCANLLLILRRTHLIALCVHVHEWCIHCEHRWVVVCTVVAHILARAFAGHTPGP